MKHVKALAMCAAFALTPASLFILASPALGQRGPLVVTAAPQPELVTRHVGYADLNLASTAGERALNNRVDVAVNDVCLESTGGDNGSFTFKFSMKRCSGSAWDQARPQIAQAVQRAREIASTGSSSIAAAAVTISLPQ